MKASEKRMSELHAQLTETLIEATKSHEVEDVTTDSEGNETRTVRVALPHPASLAVAAKFLKDNSIFADPETDDAAKELKDQLAKRGRAPSKQDLADAMRAIGGELLQ